MSEQKIEAYMIVGAGDPQTLCDDVGSMITEGWQPLGGVAICENSRNVSIVDDETWDFQFVQAMVRYEAVLAMLKN